MRHIYKIKTFPGLKTFEKQYELLDISLQSSKDKTDMRNDKIFARKGEIKTIRTTKVKHNSVN